MTISEIVARLRAHIDAMNLELVRPIDESSRFVEDLGLDSLDLVEFVARFEHEFALYVPDEDLVAMVSLRATAEYIASAAGG